mgnify:CR=1 FL=1
MCKSKVRDKRKVMVVEKGRVLERKPVRGKGKGKGRGKGKGKGKGKGS